MKKRLIALLLMLCLLTSMLPVSVQAVDIPFTDVSTGRFYYDAVLWAVENGVTAGTSATTFSPDANCSRSQVVTFLWRALGKPGNSGENPFTDIVRGQFYYDAVLWAAEAGVTNGTSATTFSPDAPVTRAQFVTFLWRALNKPATTGSNPFTDVAAGHFYSQAVLWAAEAGVTTGTGAGRFSPDASCQRSQTVTFLWRALSDDAPDTPANPLPSAPEPINKTETVYRTVKLTNMNGQTYWRFDVNLHNASNKTVSLKKVTIQNLCGGYDQGTPYVDIVAESNLGIMFDLVASPGETINWVDDHPVTYAFNGRRYTLEFEDTAGNTYVRTYILTFSYDGYENPAADNAPDFGETAEQTIYVRNNRWDYSLYFRNNTDKTLSLKRIECEDYINGASRGPTWVFEGERLQDLWLPRHLAPGQLGGFDDGHPFVEDMDTRIYRFIYEDDNGTEYAAATVLTLSPIQVHPELETIYPDFSRDNGKNAFTLRHDANYCVEVGDGVYWVPANTLGTSDYTNAQIQAMLTATPEQKRDTIDTLYEALQLYQIGGFYGSDDNFYLDEYGLQWEHHKPGYHAVRTNNGCCATSANWLHYILDGDYEEIGFYSYYGLGGGHVFNYIKHNGWYYFADLTSWPAGNINVNAIESGNINDFYNSDIIGGNILKAASLEDFADYILEVINDPPGLIYVRQTDNVSPSATLWLMGGQELVFTDDVDVTVLYDDPDDPIAYRTLPAPQRSNNWARYEDFRFDQMQFQ